MCKHMKKMKCNAWKEKRKDKQRKEKKSIAKERKEKEKENEWGTKCLDQFSEIKWATQWKLRVEKNAQNKL